MRHNVLHKLTSDEILQKSANFGMNITKIPQKPTALYGKVTPN
ncbi:hypothetical protein [Pasteurella bettyae]|uniref:Uncharacterized protein n=1 Tax=Pasteurella bettyae CCUG 2042 TaxID=1095749 RepID=I3DFB5_9PAST|nr:hypothetical protein [Pasteurella bettyae]EIJ70408.1 hypothetical protein HMPREF1052_1469 [Pasteurella bettyae CCUG 2042]